MTDYKAERTFRLLKEKKYHITFAESCTGGMAAARLVDVPDASTVFEASFVTYANWAKTRFADVPEELILEHGVVSEPVAGAMASGAAFQTGAEVGVGISGIAGPSGATADKPVGMVCFGFYIDGIKHTDTKYFGDIGRKNVRKSAVEHVYTVLCELLESR